MPGNGGGTGFWARQTRLAHGHPGDLVEDGGDAGGLVEKLGRARPVAVEVGKGFHPGAKPPAWAIARAVVPLKPLLTREASVASRTRARVSDNAYRPYAVGGEVGVEPTG